jgi:hypothetical protein
LPLALAVAALFTRAGLSLMGRRRPRRA